MAKNKKRPVEFISERKLKPTCDRDPNDRSTWYEETKMNGIFHQFGSEIEEGENEVATLTVGIIEDEAGQIHSVVPEWIKFLDR